MLATLPEPFIGKRAFSMRLNSVCHLRRSLVFLLSCAGVSIWGLAEAADVVISNGGTLGGTSVMGFDMGQSFTATKTGRITSIEVAASNNVSGTATLTIYAGAGSGGTVLYTKSGIDFSGVAAIVDPNVYGYTAISVDSEVNITSGNVYTFRLSPKTAIDIAYVNSNNYAGGALFSVDLGGFQNGNDIPFKVTQSDPLYDSDGNLTAGPGAETTLLASTVDTVGEAIDLMDFTITDGGGGDARSLTASQIVLHLGGTSSNTERSQIAWRLNGPDVSNVTGVYNSGSQTVTFSGLSIDVADGGNETYTVNAYFNSTSNLTDGHTVTLSVDGDTDVTVGTSTSHFGATTAVSNGSGAAIGVVATQLVFKTQPAGSVSGAALTTQPAVAATDAFGNTDIDFTGNVTVTEASPGALSGTNNQAAVGGTATFSNLAYTATADQESFTLTASSAGLTDGAANAVTSDVVATKLLFTTQPAPTSLTSGSATSFATVPVVKAVNAGDVVDTGYSTAVVLGVTDPADSIVDGTVNNLSGTGDTDGSGVTVTLSPASGVATFTGLGIQYTNGGASDTIALHATSGGLTAANSASLTVVLPLPTLSSATYDAATGVLAVTAANMTGGDTISVSKLTLTGEGGIPYALTSADVTASSATSFSVTLNSTDKEAVNRILNKNGTASTGATAYNLAAADDWDANSTSGDSSDPSNGVTVSNVAQPTITSATYDAATGVLAVTGTGLLSAAGSANDIVATKFSLFGQGAGAYTLTDTANVDIDSSTAFTMSLSATDQAGVNAVLDKNGTASQDNTPYNLIAAEDWAAGADPSVNVADTSGNGITVSNATDNDGVPNAVEDGVANPSGGGSGDGNGDGIQDSLQGHVASLPAAVGGAVVTLATRDASVPLAGVTALPAPNDPPPGVSFPFGMFSFTITGVGAGATENVQLFVPYNPAINGYWKKNNANAWVNIATSITRVGNKTRIVFPLTEGGPFDSDGNPATITDPGGPGALGLTTPVPTLSEWGMILLSGLMALGAVLSNRRQPGASRVGAGGH